MTHRLSRGHEVVLTKNLLGFLCGDLRVSFALAAELLGVSELVLREAVDRIGVRWSHHVFGTMSRGTFRAFAREMGFQVEAELVAIPPRHEGEAFRALAIRELATRAKSDTLLWTRLDGFLQRLPTLQAVTRDRVTEPRLRFLYGDLGASQVEIMQLLDAPFGLICSGIIAARMDLPHERSFPSLRTRDLALLAERLGADASGLRPAAESPGAWSAAKRMVRGRMLDLARDGRLDLGVLDGVLAEAGSLRVVVA